VRPNLNSRNGLIRRLRRSRESRAAFVSSHVDKTVAFQLRAIRGKQGLSQEQLAEMVGMNQNAISRLESEWYGKSTIRTLKRLAAALDVALVVRFVPYSQLVDWVSGTPFEDTGLSTESLAVPNFDQEEEEGNFEDAAVVAASVAAVLKSHTAAGAYANPDPLGLFPSLEGPIKFESGPLHNLGQGDRPAFRPLAANWVTPFPKTGTN